MATAIEAMESPAESSSRSSPCITELPSALICTILMKLDVVSLCSVASTCRSFHGCAFHTLSFVPAFHLLDIAPTLDLLWPLLPRNPYLESLKLDCGRLDDSSFETLLRPSLGDLCLLNCKRFSGALLYMIGCTCSHLRSLSIGSLAEQRRMELPLSFSDLEKLITGCLKLESLCLAFDFSEFHHARFGQLWENASGNLLALKIGYIPMLMVLEMLNTSAVLPPYPRLTKPQILQNLQKLCLSVDNITDTLIASISRNLVSLTHLDLQDAPLIEPSAARDLTNAGLQMINQCGKLKHISLIRSQDFVYTYFRRVNDLGVLLMADTCSSLESIYLGGFCRVTDTGFRAILHSCHNLHKLKVSFGSQLTDLVFHDISATSLSLTHVSLRRCTLLTNLAILRLTFNLNLAMVDLRECWNVGDEALRAISSLPKLQILLLDCTDITDLGVSYLGNGLSSLVSLSVRGCRRLTDNCVSAIFGGSLGQFLHVLDLSSNPNISDAALLMLARSKVSLVELRIRDCPRVGDTSVMALASMHTDAVWRGSSLQLLDLYECRGITQLAFRWFKKPYFTRLRWLGVTGSTNRDMVDALLRSRPLLHVAIRGEELGTSYWDTSCGWFGPDQDELDELEQWLLDGEYVSDEDGDDDDDDTDVD